MKAFLDTLVSRYKTAAYIPTDPISLPHRYLQDPKTCELVAFFTALFSYGRRDLIIQAVNDLLARMDHDPRAFVAAYSPKADRKVFDGFVYRFNKSADVDFLVQRLQWAYREYDSLEELYLAGKTQDFKTSMAVFIDTLVGNTPLKTYGQKFLFAHPRQGGACKRLNMFLRWVVRQDAPDEDRVDLGLWKRALRPADLMLPLDTHVSKMNRVFGFSARQTASWEMAAEMTAALRAFCPEDPIKYDYALMGYSLEGGSTLEIPASVV